MIYGTNGRTRRIRHRERDGEWDNGRDQTRDGGLLIAPTAGKEKVLETIKAINWEQEKPHGRGMTERRHQRIRLGRRDRYTERDRRTYTYVERDRCRRSDRRVSPTETAIAVKHTDRREQIDKDTNNETNAVTDRETDRKERRLFHYRQMCRVYTSRYLSPSRIHRPNSEYER